MSPELRELLGAIADDPRARLLHVAPGQVAHEALESSSKVSPSAPFLRKAERRLLEAHREELGRLLYSYAHLARTESPESKRRVHYQDWGGPAPTKVETDHRSQALLGNKVALENEAEIELLKRCLASTCGVHPSEIIGALLRVAPSSKAQVVLGLDRSLEGAPPEGAVLLNEFLGRGPKSRFDSYAWENLGFAATLMGRPQQAASSYEAAVRADVTRVAPALDWLRFSLVIEARDSALRAADHVDRSVPVNSPILRWHQLESVPSLASSPGRKALARILAARGGQASRSVINEFA
jgi:hypothetical protein